MRSPKEILYRLTQEAANLWLFTARPKAEVDQPSPLAGLPDPQAVADSLRGTPYAVEVERTARRILEGRFPLLGLEEVVTGDEIRWRRDPVHGRESGLAYFRRVPYLRFDRVGDHKLIWELNRHQHLVLLAQAFLLSSDRRFLEGIPRHLKSWHQANPFLRGINWASALEVAFRSLSWMWVYHLAGRWLEETVRRLLLNGIFGHGLYLEHNLSIYFSPNTHLLGEAVALDGLGRLFPALPRAGQWVELGARLVARQMDRQVREDGSHFEQSAYYHVYALDLFLLHLVLNPGVSEAYRQKLGRMADYLDGLLGACGCLPLLGDDDGGRVFHPYGDRRRFGLATLATSALALKRPEWLRAPEAMAEQAAWWLGPQALVARSQERPRSRLFPQAGVAIMTGDDLRVLVNAGPFGAGTAGHSHSDTLSLTLTRGADEVLIDPGTFTYVADAEQRQWFRSSAAHNTVRIDERDQATPNGPFRWKDLPRVEVLRWDTGGERDVLDAACHYRGFTHRRTVWFHKPHLVVVLDRIAGPPGEHLLEQFWHCAGEVRPVSPRCYRVGAAFACPAGDRVECGLSQRSRAFATKEASWMIRVERRAALPAVLATAWIFGATAAPRGLRLTQQGEACLLVLDGDGQTPRFEARL